MLLLGSGCCHSLSRGGSTLYFFPDFFLNIKGGCIVSEGEVAGAAGSATEDEDSCGRDGGYCVSETSSGNGTVSLDQSAL